MVVGLCGRIAAGKGEAADFIASKYDASIIRFSDILKDVLVVLGKEDSRENLQTLGAGLRGAFSDNILIEAMKDRINKLDAKAVVVDGVRYVPEAELVSSFTRSILVYIDAPIDLRYERTLSRGTRGEADQTKAEFMGNDEGETEQTLGRLRELADVVIDNTGSMQDLHDKISVAVASLPS